MKVGDAAGIKTLGHILLEHGVAVLDILLLSAREQRGAVGHLAEQRPIAQVEEEERAAREHRLHRDLPPMQNMSINNKVGSSCMHGTHAAALAAQSLRRAHGLLAAPRARPQSGRAACTRCVTASDDACCVARSSAGLSL